MDAAIEGLKDDGKFNVKDLGEEAVDKVIEGLKGKRKMTASQVAYIKGMVSRAQSFTAITES